MLINILCIKNYTDNHEVSDMSGIIIICLNECGNVVSGEKKNAVELLPQYLSFLKEQNISWRLKIKGNQMESVWLKDSDAGRA